MTRKLRYLPLLLAALLVACGSQGAVQGQVMGINGSGEMPKILQGATVVANCAGSEATGTTGSEGRYRIEKLKAGPCGIAISAPPEARLQPDAAQFRLEGGELQTINRVLLAEGMQRPPSPPPDAQYRDFNRSMASDPFFWYWVWSSPWLYPSVYGSRPYLYAGYGSGGTVVVDSRTYPPPSGYKEVNTVTAAPSARPQPVDVKGVARPSQMASQAAASKPSNFSSNTAANTAATGVGASFSSDAGAKPPSPSSASSTSASARSSSSSGGGAKPPPPKK